MRIIAIVLLIAACVSLIPVNALWLGTLDNTCVVVVFTPIEILLSLLGLFLMGGYSSVIAGRMPWNSPRVFWAVSSLFNGAIACFGIFYILGSRSIIKIVSSSASSVQNALTPNFNPGYLLEALGEFTFPIIVIWMPFAAILSVVALWLAWKNQIKFIEPGDVANDRPAGIRS